jgi:hypothetical protein
MTTTLHQKMIKKHRFLSQACRPSSVTSLNLALGAALAADLLLKQENFAYLVMQLAAPFRLVLHNVAARRCGL